MATLLRRVAVNRDRPTRRAPVRYGMGAAGLAFALLACASSASPGPLREGVGSDASSPSTLLSASMTGGPSPSVVASEAGAADSQPTVTPTPIGGRLVFTNADAAALAYHVVPVGTIIEVHLDAFSPSPATIAAPQSLDDSIVRTISSSGDHTRHSQAAFRAVGIGKTSVGATEYGACKGACAEPALSIFIDVVR